MLLDTRSRIAVPIVAAFLLASEGRRVAPSGREDADSTVSHGRLLSTLLLSEGSPQGFSVKTPSSMRNRPGPAPKRLSHRDAERGVAQSHRPRSWAPRMFTEETDEPRVNPGGPKGYARLIFSRHGQSEWNKANLFTGWVDCPLTEKGIEEAEHAGELLKREGVKIDVCFTSVLKRAVKTANIALDLADQLHVPVKKSWRLNERMYGSLQGSDKKQTVKEYGAEKVQVWRRSFDIPPPPISKADKYYTGDEYKYKDLKDEDIPLTESLKDVIARVMPYWKENIEHELRKGKTVFVAAHGNSIRAVVKDIEGISDEDISGLEIPTGTPLVFELDADLKPIANSLAVAPLRYGRYLGDADKIAAAAAAVRDQTKVG